MSNTCSLSDTESSDNTDRSDKADSSNNENDSDNSIARLMTASMMRLIADWLNKINW